MVPERVMEFSSYHAIVACVAAGAGVALVPQSVIRVVAGVDEVAVNRLPRGVSKARTVLAWRRGHDSSALHALRQQLKRTKQ